MRQISNKTVSVFLRCLPLILDHVKPGYKETRLINAMRQVRNELDKLKEDGTGMG